MQKNTEKELVGAPKGNLPLSTQRRVCLLIIPRKGATLEENLLEYLNLTTVMATSILLVTLVTIVFHLSANERGPGTFPFVLDHES